MQVERGRKRLVAVGQCTSPLPASYCQLPVRRRLRTATPPPRKDRGTQVRHGEWLLFDFDGEAAPVVAVLTARVLDAAAAEALAEGRQAVREARAEKARGRRVAAAARAAGAAAARARRVAERQARRAETVAATELAAAAVRKLVARAAAGAVVRRLGAHDLPQSTALPLPAGVGDAVRRRLAAAETARALVRAGGWSASRLRLGA